MPTTRGRPRQAAARSRRRTATATRGSRATRRGAGTTGGLFVTVRNAERRRHRFGIIEEYRSSEGGRHVRVALRIQKANGRAAKSKAVLSLLAAGLAATGHANSLPAPRQWEMPVHSSTAFCFVCSEPPPTGEGGGAKTKKLKLRVTTSASRSIVRLSSFRPSVRVEAEPLCMAVRLPLYG